LESKSLEAMQPLYGLIFLFKWQKETDPRPVLADGMYPGVFYASQVITNACATQAMLSILLNRPDVDVGPELASFKAFTQDLPSDMRGLAISNSTPIRTAHNSFARPEPFEYDGRKATEKDDVFHFVAYVPVDGQVYELDGLKEGPILLGACDMSHWHTVAATTIRERVSRYNAKEIKFNLLALHEKPRDRLEKELRSLKSQEGEIKGRLTDLALPADERTRLQGELQACGPKISECEAGLQNEHTKSIAWQRENVRRKHNYIPFTYNLLKILAAKGKLVGLIAAAEKAQKDRQAAKDKATKDAKDKEAAAKDAASKDAATKEPPKST